MGAPADPAPPEGWHAVAGTWPNAGHSRFVRASGLVWHVQRLGMTGAPKCLLVHGTGASTHSFDALMRLLAERFDVLAPDLPGHGFTSEARGRVLSLPGMADALAGLLDTLDFAPAIAAGHSAGAAILIEMALGGRIEPAALIGLNSALEPIEGNAIFSPLAKALFVNPFTAHTVAFQARHTRLPRRLLANTGSALDEATIGHYETLVGMPSHVAGALGMMANWDLEPLQRRLADLKTPTTLIVNEDDRMVPPRVSRHAATLTNSATILSLPSGGHLAHEAAPHQFAEIIEETARSTGLLDTVEAAQ